MWPRSEQAHCLTGFFSKQTSETVCTWRMTTPGIVSSSVVISCSSGASSMGCNVVAMYALAGIVSYTLSAQSKRSQNLFALKVWDPVSRPSDQKGERVHRNCCNLCNFGRIAPRMGEEGQTAAAEGQVASTDPASVPAGGWYYVVPGAPPIGPYDEAGMHGEDQGAPCNGRAMCMRARLQICACMQCLTTCSCLHTRLHHHPPLAAFGCTSCIVQRWWWEGT